MTSVVQDRISEISSLCRKHRVRALEAFGSAIGETFDPKTSDIDLLVEFEGMSAAAHADAFFGLLEDLQRLLGCDVDLVESRAVRNPYFLEAVQNQKVPVYAAS